MSRRNFIAGALALGAAAIFAPGMALAQEGPAVTETTTPEQQQSYVHKRLDSTTLSQYPDDQKTIADILNSDEFKGKFVIVELVAGWCPHCAKMKPEMDKAVADLAAQGANIARLTIVYQEGVPGVSKGAYAYRNTFSQMSKSGSFPETQIWNDGKFEGYFSGEVPSAVIVNGLKQAFPDLVPAQPVQPAPQP